MLITKTKGISFALFFLLTICVSLSQNNSKLALLVAANLHQSRTLAHPARHAAAEALNGELQTTSTS